MITAHDLFFANNHLFFDLHAYSLPFSLKSLMDFFYQCLKSLFYIKIRFCTNFNKGNSILSGNGCSLLCRNLSFKIKIAFCCQKNSADIRGCMSFDLSHPAFHVLKRSSIDYRIRKYDACSAFIVSLSNIFESFLPGSVPNL